MKTFIFGIYQIFKKPWIFVITTIMLAVGLAVSFYSFIVYDYFHFPTKQAKKALAYDMDHVYKIDFGLTMLGIHPDDISKMKLLLDDIKNMDEANCWGGYYFSNDEINKLYVSPSLIDICKVQTVENDAIDFDYTGFGNEYGIAYVGKNLSDKYNVGSVYFDEETECEYMVKGVMKEDSLWLPDSIYGDADINLNNTLLIDFDYIAFTKKNDIFISNICNMLFISSYSPDIKDDIFSLCEKHEIDIVKVESMKELYASYEKDAMDNAGENYLLPLVLLLSAIIVAIITSKMSILSNKRDYGIMISNGFTKAEIIGMALVENIVTCICAFLLCTLYWKVQYMNMDDFTRIIYDDMFLFRNILFVLIVMIVSIVPIRHLLFCKPSDLINKLEL